MFTIGHQGGVREGLVIRKRVQTDCEACVNDEQGQSACKLPITLCVPPHAPLLRVSAIRRYLQRVAEHPAFQLHQGLGQLPPVWRDAQIGNPNPLHIIVSFLSASCLDGLPPVRRDV
jgi:hypothetical protein